MARAFKTRASKQQYVSTTQPPLPGFETPFHNHLNPANRWVVLAKRMPWDELVNVYQRQMNNSRTGADGINPPCCYRLSDYKTHVRFERP